MPTNPDPNLDKRFLIKGGCIEYFSNSISIYAPFKSKDSPITNIQRFEQPFNLDFDPALLQVSILEAESPVDPSPSVSPTCMVYESGRVFIAQNNSLMKIQTNEAIVVDGKGLSRIRPVNQGSSFEIMQP